MQGSGIAADTPKKPDQMKFAAAYYSLINYTDAHLRFAVATLIGHDFSIEQWIPL